MQQQGTETKARRFFTPRSPCRLHPPTMREEQKIASARTAFLTGQGFQVLRFWNSEVLRNPDGVLTTIAASLDP